MENGAGDALAHSQLARLYKLGLIQQDAGEVENDPHAFLNRLPPPSTQLGSQGERMRPRTSSFQSSGDHSSDGFKDSTDHSPFTRVRPYPLSSAMDMTRPPPRFEMTSRVPLSPMSTASRPTLPPPPFETLSLRGRETRKDTETRETKQRWFNTWKRCVVAKWTLKKAHAAASRNVKRRVLKNWQDGVYKTHLDNARGRQLVSWRMQRAVRSWRAWAALHGRVTWFLTAQGRSHALLNRLRRERTWIRWKRFVKQSCKQKKMVEKAVQWRRAQCVRQTWLQWRVLALSGRRRRRFYRVFMAALRGVQEERRCRWAIALELYDRHAEHRLRRLLKRWRVFNNKRQRDHQRAYHIRMIMTRGKFFAIWHTTMQQTAQIDTLRRRVQRRVWRDHLRAWCVAAQASKLGRTSTLWHPEAICARYLRVWKCWTHDTLRFRFATSVVQKKQKKHALRVMRAWTKEHARISRLCKAADAITRRRILTLVWESGLLAFYFRRKQEKQLATRIRAMSLARALHQWRFEWRVRHEWRSKKQLARKMAFSIAVKGVWNGWQRYLQWRHQHKQHIDSASRHDHHRLILRGLLALSNAVEQTSEWAKACRQIRIQQRDAWKRRVFMAWQRHARKMLLLDENLELFVTRTGYTTSIWNPLRRRWTMWIAFTRLKTLTRQGIQLYEQSWKRRLFDAWRRAAILLARQRAHIQCHEVRLLKKSVAEWKVQTNREKMKQNHRAAAASCYRQTQGVKVLRAWRMFARLRGRVKKSGEDLHAAQCSRQTVWWFSLWRRSFTLKQGISALKQRRRHAWLQFCWDAWYQNHLDANRMKKKLMYYHRVFGAHPSTSPFARQWGRWKEWTRRRCEVKQLTYDYELRQAGKCLSAWKTFRLAKMALRRWHRFSIIAGATHNDLGKRCRLIREQRHRRVLLSCFRGWVDVSKARQRLYEKLHEHRSQVLDEIIVAQAKRVKYTRCNVRLWFQRWRRRQLVSVHLAMHWHRMRLMRTTFLSWWRHVVHGKQERLLEDARRTMDSLSVNKPKVTRLKRVTLRDVPKEKKAKPKPLPPARMVDPLPVRRSYLQPSQRLPAKQSLRELPGRDTRDAIAQRAQESVENYRKTVQRQENGYTVRDVDRISERRDRRSVSQSVSELPLFDDAIATTTALLAARAERAANECDTVMTLESIASMDLYNLPRQPKAATSITEMQETPSRSTRDQAQRPDSDARLFTPSQSLVPQPRESIRPSMNRGEKSSSRGLRPQRTQQDLVQLLEIPQQQKPPPVSTFRSVLRGISTETRMREPLDVDVHGIVGTIINYYVIKAQHLSSVASEQQDTWLQTMGFCLLRDLGLFENGHYLSAMERTIQLVTSGSSGDEPRVSLQLLLEAFIEHHPARKSSKHTDGLSWLVQRHLVRRYGHAAVVQANAKPFWIRHELPNDVIVGLPKLIKVFKKYQKPLEMFFTWRPESSGALASKTDCRMDLATFIQLMKHCHVHPQLLDRRALEEAVGCAGVSTYRGQDAGMSLPHFLEAVVRCALNLQWMDERSNVGRNAEHFPELVVVVKFLMLVFTMEGRGSMLAKRSQDLDVLVGFLQRQQRDTSSEKLRRFQELLRAEPPRVHETSEKKRHRGQSNTFRTFMGGNLNDDDGRGAVVHLGHEGGGGLEREHEPSKYTEQVREYRDLISPSNMYDEHRPSHQLFRGHQRDAQVNRTQRRDQTPTRVETMDPVRHWLPSNTTEGRHENEAIHSEPRALQTPPRVAHPGDLDEEKAHPLAVSAGEARPNLAHAASAAREQPSIHSIQTATPTTVVSELPATPRFGLQPPMDREAFLDEILSSITDVELLLQQADERRGSSKLAPSSDPDNTVDSLVQLSSEPFSVAYPERYALVTTGQLPSLDRCSPDDVDDTEDIRVDDPVLDSLTFADRFSESANWESHLTIADVAELGIHAAFPSSMHLLGRVHTGELDELTHPQPAISHLRAIEDDGVTASTQFLGWSSEREWIAALQDTEDMDSSTCR